MSNAPSSNCRGACPLGISFKRSAITARTGCLATLHRGASGGAAVCETVAKETDKYFTALGIKAPYGLITDCIERASIPVVCEVKKCDRWALINPKAPPRDLPEQDRSEIWPAASGCWVANNARFLV